MWRIPVLILLALLGIVLMVHVSSGCGRTALSIGCPQPGDEVADLTGFWRDGGHTDLVVFSIVQDGVIVTSTRLEPKVCDHRDGQDTTSQSPDDFIGVVEGCSIKGQITLCRFGLQPPDDHLNGMIKLEFDATLSFDHARISGSWSDSITGDSGTGIWERLGCQPKSPDDYLLPGSEVIDFTTEHELDIGRITYSGTAPLGIEISRRVVAGVTGAVQGVTPAAGGDPLVIAVIVGNGNRIVYSLFGQFPTARVSPGDAVDPATEIGTVTASQNDPDLFKLQLEAFEGITDTPVNPDCVEE